MPPGSFTVMCTDIEHLLFIDLSLFVVSHNHQHWKENKYKEVGDQKWLAIDDWIITSKSSKFKFEITIQDRQWS